jgi:hypothetical protein
MLHLKEQTGTSLRHEPQRCAIPFLHDRTMPFSVENARNFTSIDNMEQLEN